MIPIAIMVIAWLVFRALGAMGYVRGATTTVGALRFALALMFIFTAISHFAPATRGDMVRMVPPSLPFPELLVTLTGLLELAGAAGLLISAWTSTAAYCLMALLIAMFPANVYAASAGIEIGGQPAMALVWRLPLQLLWIGALWWVGRSFARARRGTLDASGQHT